MQGTRKPEAPQALAPVELPLPVDDRNPSIFTAIEHSGMRAPRVTPLPPQQLSNILWSTWGANRRDGHSAHREIEIFVVYDRSAYRYNARGNQLQTLPAFDGGMQADGRSTSTNAAADTVQLIYVAKWPQARSCIESSGEDLPEPQMRGGHYCADTGSIAGKVYLFASAYGISAMPQPCDRAHLALRLGLKAEQQVLFAQAIRCPRQSGVARGRAV